jgi:two-component system NarL family response regulator
MGRIAILIVDDNFVARRGLRSFLETEADITVAGEASTGRAAIEWIKGRPADIVLMDVRMPDTDGIEATAEIIEVRPETRVLMLTVVDDQSTLLRALLAGAKGYLVYGRFTPEVLVAAIRAIMSGQTVTVPQVAHALLEHIRSHVSNVHDIAEMENMEPLTAREKEILSLIAIGKGNRDIAETLNVEEKTVKNHINNIYSKLQIKSRYEAISYMFRAH